MNAEQTCLLLSELWLPEIEALAEVRSESGCHIQVLCIL